MSGAITAGHAPGPWTFDGEPDNIIVWSGPLLRVCFLTSTGPTVANAHLITAAPELLDLAEQGLQSMQQDLAGVLESVCLLDDKLQPRRDTAEEEFLPEIEALEARIAAGKQVIAKALGGMQREPTHAC